MSVPLHRWLVSPGHIPRHNNSWHLTAYSVLFAALPRRFTDPIILWSRWYYYSHFMCGKTGLESKLPKLAKLIGRTSTIYFLKLQDYVSVMSSEETKKEQCLDKAGYRKIQVSSENSMNWIIRGQQDDWKFGFGWRGEERDTEWERNWKRQKNCKDELCLITILSEKSAADRTLCYLSYKNANNYWNSSIIMRAISLDLLVFILGKYIFIV